MRSNYRKIGDYIELVDDRNRDLSITHLLGLSINKIFIPSVANIIGSDMANYKIIRKGQFACSLMQVRRDGKIPVALLDEFDEAIISQAYPVFKVKDTEKLLPEYLMMWMSRSEFDRQACFLAVGGVRGSLEWDDFCEMELPVPSIDKQLEIVKEYNTIVNRIKINEQLNQKLEETAQTVYKQWFVDFEFPISQEYANSINKPELTGKPYKSNGGEMVYNKQLEKDIPKGWNNAIIADIGTQKRKAFNLKKNFTPTAYIGLEHMPKKSIALINWDIVTAIGSNKHRFAKGDILFGKLRPYFHKVGVALIDGICSTDIIVSKPLNPNYFGLLLMILSSNDFIQYANSGSGGTKMPRTDWAHMSSYPITKPSTEVIETFNNYLKIILINIEVKSKFLRMLKDSENIMLSSMASKQLEAVV